MKIVVVSTSLLAIWIAFEKFWVSYTFEGSIETTLWVQQGNEILQTFNSLIYLFSKLGDRSFTNALLYIIWQIAGRKEQVLKLITMYSLSMFFGDFLKLVLIQERPFYLNSSIQINDCFTGYGDPSGHTFRSFVFYVILAESIFFKKFKQQDEGLMVNIRMVQLSNQDLYNQYYPNSILSYNQWKILGLIFVFLAGISRIWLGVHFINQVIFGWILGAYALTLYYYCGLEQFLEYYILTCASQDNRLLGLDQIINKDINYICYTLFIESNQEELQETKQIWVQQIAKQPKCNPSLKYFEDSDIVQMSVVIFPFYLYLSCIISNGQYSPQDYPGIMFNFKGLLRVSIPACLIGVAYLIQQYLKKLSLPILAKYMLIGYLILCEYSCYIDTLRIDVKGDLFRKVSEVEQIEMEL
ncbi:hypothetical protein pb186bvf_001769 [Paramecium bursaria]